MLARAEVTLTKGEMVRNRSHEATKQLWDVFSKSVYQCEGAVMGLKPTLTVEGKISFDNNWSCIEESGTMDSGDSEQEMEVGGNETILGEVVRTGEK
jgi:hypothetical protein